MKTKNGVCMAVIKRMERKQRGSEKDQVVFPVPEAIMNMPVNAH